MIIILNNNEITPRTKNNYEKDSNLSKNKANKLNNSKNSEKLPSRKKYKNKISLNNNSNQFSPESTKKDLNIYLKNIPYENNFKKEDKDKNESSNFIKNSDKYDYDKEIFEEKERITTGSFHDNCLNTNYGCRSPNFLLLKKLLKNSQSHYQEENDNDANNIQESIVYNAQRETQVFNINQKLSKIKRLNRIYENEINNITPNEIKNKEYFSSNNSNSNLRININKTIKDTNEIPKNNYVYHKRKIKGNNEISPIRKLGFIFNGLNSNEERNSKNKLSNHKSSNNTNNINNKEIIRNENNAVNKKKYLKSQHIHSINGNKINNDNFFSPNESNRPSLRIHSPKKKFKENYNINNKILESERNDFKYIITNINYLERSPLSNKNSIYFSQTKINSNSIKVNKKSKNKKSNKNTIVRQRNAQQSSLTSKLNSIKKNFNLSNKDIFILENKKEDVINYLRNDNKKYDTTRSQKYINNNRSLGDTINLSIKRDTSKNRNKYSSLIENNSIYIEKIIKSDNSNKETSNSVKKKNKFGLFNHRNHFFKQKKDRQFNDENQNCNNKIKKKNRYTMGLGKNYKYSFNEFLSLENTKEYNCNSNVKEAQNKRKINRSVSNKKESLYMKKGIIKI